MSLSRRTLFAATAGTLAGTRLQAAGPASTTAPLTFVCVPGTWHGGWVWTPLAEALAERGHQCFRVTCTGVGEREHLLTPEVGLATHVTDVLNVIRFEGLENVILVGHSFAGVTITDVADRLTGSGSIAGLLYYDAFIPTPERPAWVMRTDDGAWPDWWQARQANFVDGYKMSFFAEYPLKMLVDDAAYPEAADIVRNRLTYHPARQWVEPASFANGGWQSYPRGYIHCTGQAYRQTSAAMYGPAQSDGWVFETSPTHRLGMFTHPDLTAELFERTARALLQPARREPA